MDKLREQIARKLWDMSSCMSMESCEIITDAILALLQPRMLSKDEAFCLSCDDNCDNQEGLRCTKHGVPSQPCEIYKIAQAKLKLIQEEE